METCPYITECSTRPIEKENCITNYTHCLVYQYIKSKPEEDYFVNTGHFIPNAKRKSLDNKLKLELNMLNK